MEENLAPLPSARSAEGSSLVEKRVGSEPGRSRVKPLIINSESEEEGSSSDDLPDGV